MALQLPTGRPLFLDGGMGTQLQARGLAAGEIPELWNLSRPDDIRAVHAAYLAAGADVIYANTFGANAAKYHGDAPLADVIAAGVQIAREAGSEGRDKRDPPLVALDVGPTGRLLKPAGDFEFDAAYDAFAEQVRLGAEAGADLVVIETMGDTYELKAAVLAAKENCNLPVIATVALGEDGKLLTGGDVECVAALLEGLRVDALGFNCGLGPDKMRPYVERLARVVSCPIAVKPNAGMPKVVDGQTVFTVGPEAFAADVADLIAAGASIVGGCCGTTPAHIAAVTARLAATSAALPQKERRCVISSGTHALEIPLDDTIVIGERINPTGKKRLKTALAEGDTAYVLREAVSQAEAGAAVLDVNTGVPGLDEASVLDRTVQVVQGVVDLPLQIDTSDPVALERALRHYNGKALVNSVNGKEESLSAVLPLVAKYGGVVVALALDEHGIPPTAEGRLAIARKILARGAEYGLGPNDFVFDALCLAVSADATSASVVLETLRRVRAELGCRTVLGVSNISFGLPGRPHLNAAFYTLAMGAGLSAAIINPLSAEMMAALGGNDGRVAGVPRAHGARPFVRGVDCACGCSPFGKRQECRFPERVSGKRRSRRFIRYSKPSCCGHPARVEGGCRRGRACRARRRTRAGRNNRWRDRVGVGGRRARLRGEDRVSAAAPHGGGRRRCGVRRDPRRAREIRRRAHQGEGTDRDRHREGRHPRHRQEHRPCASRELRLQGDRPRT